MSTSGGSVQLDNHSQNVKRPVAFVLASSDQGTLILNRNDGHTVGDRHFGVGIELLVNGSFCADEVALATRLLDLRRAVHGDGVVAIDCGANIGVHTVSWAKRMTGWGHVVAIEAQERIYYALAGNIALNNCFNAQALHAAASDQDGVLRIPTPDYLRRASFGSLELKRLARPEDIGQAIDYSDAALTPVRCLRLDSLGLARLDLVKIDVEGMELEVLRGSAAVLERFRPIILIEPHKSDGAALLGVLRAAGYQVHNTGGMNLLAVHGEDACRRHIVEEAHEAR